MLLDIKNTLKEVTSRVNIGNYDGSLEEYLCDILRKYSNDVYTKNGNVIANFGIRTDDKPHILLDAHIDQIGMVVTYITDEGFIKVSNVGGLDKRLLSAQEVTIHGKKNILGVICTLPPHIKGNEDEVLNIDDIFIDTGYPKERLENIVSLGDYVSFRKDFLNLVGDRVSSPSLDDRCGVVALLKVAEALHGISLDCSYTIMFSNQEEVGERGALIGAYDINPDYAIEVDVSFGLTNSENPRKCGELGKGAMIGFAPVLDRCMSKQLVQIADSCNIPYQVEIMNGETGTNADRFSVSRGGVKAVTVSIPLKYMHTPVEVIDVNDVQYTANLVVEYLKRLH
ncbi:MAG: M42 family peptidase [Ruminococcus sp.]|nr:M42 family peptidase [Ruminococcus sp.]